MPCSRTVRGRQSKGILRNFLKSFSKNPLERFGLKDNDAPANISTSTVINDT